MLQNLRQQAFRSKSAVVAFGLALLLWLLLITGISASVYSVSVQWKQLHSSSDSEDQQSVIRHLSWFSYTSTTINKKGTLSVDDNHVIYARSSPIRSVMGASFSFTLFALIATVALCVLTFALAAKETFQTPAWKKCAAILVIVIIICALISLLAFLAINHSLSGDPEFCPTNRREGEPEGEIVKNSWCGGRFTGQSFVVTVAGTARLQWGPAFGWVAELIALPVAFIAGIAVLCIAPPAPYGSGQIVGIEFDLADVRLELGGDDLVEDRVAVLENASGDDENTSPADEDSHMPERQVVQKSEDERF